MGQYHCVYNRTKKQKLNARKMGEGLKLLEQLNSNVSNALFLLLANSNGRGGGDATPHALIGSWAGDSIVVQGDYAEEGDNGFIPYDDIESYTDISAQALEMVQNCDS